MKKSKSDTKLDKQALVNSLKNIKKYSWLILILFFIIIYGLMLYKIETFKSEQPSPTTVSSQLQTTSQPSIKPSLIKKLNQLTNKSVSVRALFNQNRQNPF